MSHIDNVTATTNPIYTYKANWCFCLTLQSTHVHTFQRQCKFWQNYKLASQGIICSDTDLIVIYIFSQSSTQNHSAASNIVKPLLEFSLVSTFISLLCFINYQILTEKNQENKINTELQESWLIIQWWIRNFKNDYQKLLIFVFSYFRSNFLRLCILKVTQQSEKHLDKILNVDEFLKRIYSVIYSNDPVARAITVRYCK